MSDLLRWLRAALLTAVVLGFGAVAHVSADGRLPGVIGMAVLALLVLAVAAAVLARPAGPVRVVVLTVLGQAGVHVVLTVTAGHGGAGHPHTPAAIPPVDTAPGRRVGSLQDFYLAGRPAPHADGGSDPLAHLLADLTGAHAPMMLAHLAAAVVVGLWLAVGERTLWAVLALTGSVLLALVRSFAAAVVAPLPPAVRQAPLRVAAAPPVPAAVARAVVRRGPPALLAA